MYELQCPCIASCICSQAQQCRSGCEAQGSGWGIGRSKSACAESGALQWHPAATSRTCSTITSIGLSLGAQSLGGKAGKERSDLRALCMLHLPIGPGRCPLTHSVSHLPISNHGLTQKAETFPGTCLWVYVILHLKHLSLLSSQCIPESKSCNCFMDILSTKLSHNSCEH